jgi:hypothetical protein
MSELVKKKVLESPSAVGTSARQKQEPILALAKV